MIQSLFLVLFLVFFIAIYASVWLDWNRRKEIVAYRFFFFLSHLSPCSIYFSVLRDQNINQFYTRCTSTRWRESMPYFSMGMPGIGWRQVFSCTNFRSKRMSTVAFVQTTEKQWCKWSYEEHSRPFSKWDLPCEQLSKYGFYPRLFLFSLINDDIFYPYYKSMTLSFFLHNLSKLVLLASQINLVNNTNIMQRCPVEFYAVIEMFFQTSEANTAATCGYGAL